MPRVLISPSARADLEKITDEIAANNGRAVAQRVTLSFERSFKVLADHPRVGRPRPRLGKNLRSWPVSVYLALY